MKLAAIEQALNDQNEARRQMPEYLIYMPPSGAPVECPPGYDVVQAGHAASKIAARNPGRPVAVYVLCGFSHQRIVEPEFTPVEVIEVPPSEDEI